MPSVLMAKHARLLFGDDELRIPRCEGCKFLNNITGLRIKDRFKAIEVKGSVSGLKLFLDLSGIEMKETQPCSINRTKPIPCWTY
jgi:hypothetical protein